MNRSMWIHGVYIDNSFLKSKTGPVNVHGQNLTSFRGAGIGMAKKFGAEKIELKKSGVLKCLPATFTSFCLLKIVVKKEKKS